MKITDSKVVQSGEKAFLNAVKDHLDWNLIREVVTKKMRQCAIEPKGGELVLHDNRIAFRMDLHCAMDVSITFDRNGTLVSDEESLAGMSKTETAFVDPGKAQASASAAVVDVEKTKDKTSDLTGNPPVVETLVNTDDGDDEDVLELNDLLDEFQPDQKTSASLPKKDDDDDVDLETLFFKDKPDDNDDEFDAIAEEGSAFWEDKK